MVRLAGNFGLPALPCAGLPGQAAGAFKKVVGSRQWPWTGPRYMICVTHFCTLRESENTWTCKNCKQARETKSDTLGHCLVGREQLHNVLLCGDTVHFNTIHPLVSMSAGHC